MSESARIGQASPAFALGFTFVRPRWVTGRVGALVCRKFYTFVIHWVFGRNKFLIFINLSIWPDDRWNSLSLDPPGTPLSEPAREKAFQPCFRPPTPAEPVESTVSPVSVWTAAAGHFERGVTELRGRERLPLFPLTSPA